MKAILEYNLPEESNEHRQALDGWKWEMVCFHLDQHLRSTVKWGDSEIDAEYADKTRDKIRELMDEYSITWSE